MRKFVVGAALWLVVWTALSLAFLGPGVTGCSVPCPEVVPDWNWPYILVGGVVGAFVMGMLFRRA